MIPPREADDVGHDDGVERVCQGAVVDQRFLAVRVRRVDGDGAAAQGMQVNDDVVGGSACDDEVVEGCVVALHCGSVREHLSAVTGCHGRIGTRGEIECVVLPLEGRGYVGVTGGDDRERQPGGRVACRDGVGACAVGGPDSI